MEMQPALQGNMFGNAACTSKISFKDFEKE
jgi:hypothetical protein